MRVTYREKDLVLLCKIMRSEAQGEGVFGILSSSG